MTTASTSVALSCFFLNRIPHCWQVSAVETTGPLQTGQWQRNGAFFMGSFPTFEFGELGSDEDLGGVVVGAFVDVLVGENFVQSDGVEDWPAPFPRAASRLKRAIIS